MTTPTQGARWLGEDLSTSAPAPAPAPAPTYSAPSTGGHVATTYSGGGTAAPAAPVGGAVTDFANMSDSEIRDYITLHYPSYAWALDIPDVAKVLFDGARQGLDPAMVQSQIEGTAWFKDTSATARQFIELGATDPATLNAKISDKALEIQQLAQQAGFSWMDQNVSTIFARGALQFGWTDAQIRQQILAKASSFSTTRPAGGTVASAAQSVKALADQYFLPLTDQQAYDYGQQIWGGSNTLEGVKAAMASQAQQSYPWLADAIARGQTGRQFLDPQIQMVASTLQLNPEQVNPLDPKWSKLLSYQDDKGQLRNMTVPEAGLFARQQTEFRYTDQANAEADRRELSILNTMGAVKS